MKMQWRHTCINALIGLIATLSSANAADRNDCLTITTNGKGKTFSVKVGQNVEVKLPGKVQDENFGWYLKTIQYEMGPTCTVIDGGVSSYIDPQSPHLGRNYTVLLKTAYPGKASISLAHSKDTNMQADATFEFSLVVDKTPDFKPPEGQPLLIDPKPLSEMLAREIGGEWQGSDSEVHLRSSPTCTFSVYFANSQHEQASILKSMESHQRSMAIIWAANGWTLVSDSHAWTDSRKQVDRVVEILSRFAPNNGTWKKKQ